MVGWFLSCFDGYKRKGLLDEAVSDFWAAKRNDFAVDLL